MLEILFYKNIEVMDHEMMNVWTTKSWL